MVPRIVQTLVLRRPATPHAGTQMARGNRTSFAAHLAGLRRAVAARPASRPALRGTEASRASWLRRDARSVGSATAAAAPGDIGAWLGTARQRSLAGAITRASEHAGIEPGLSLAVAVAESSLDPSACSPDGLSSGTFQVTSATAADIRRRFATGRLDRPPGGDDVALGVAHLRYLDEIFADDAALGGSLRTVAVDDPGERARFAVAAYNAGEGRVASAQRRAAELRRDPRRYEHIRPFLPDSTRRYVDRVMRYSGHTTALRAA